MAINDSLRSREKNSFVDDEATKYTNQSGQLMAGINTTSAPTVANNETSWLRVDTAGYLLCRLKSSITVDGELQVNVAAFETSANAEEDATVFTHNEDLSTATKTNGWLGSGGYDITADRYRALHITTDDSGMPATPLFLPVGGEYRATATTYTDGDATVLQTDVHGHLLVSGDWVYAEDSTHTTADEGSFILGIRTDTFGAAAHIAGTDKDYMGLQMNAKGGLYVDISSVLGADMSVTNGAFFNITDNTTAVAVNTAFAETEATAQASLFTTGLAMGLDTVAGNLAALQVAVDNAGLTATPNVLVAGGIYKAALDTYGDNDAVPFHFDVGGRLMTTLELNDYTDDSNEFTVATSKGLAIMGIATADAVEANDIGALRMTLNRNLGVDISEQSLTAVKVSATAAANTAANPMFTQLSNGANVLTSHDGTDLVIDNVATNDGIQTASLLYGYDDTGAAETWRALSINVAGDLEQDLIKIAGTAVNVDGGNSDAGTQTVTLADDDPAVISLALIDDAVAVFGTATYAEATTTGLNIGAVRNDALAALANTDNEIAPLQVNAKGSVYTDLSSVLGSDMSVTNGAFFNITDNTTGVGVIAGTTALKTDTSSIAGTATDTDAGNASAGSQRVTIATDDINLAAINASLTLMDDSIFADEAAYTLGTSKLTAIGAQYTAAGDTLADGQIGIPAITEDRHLIVQNEGYDSGTDSVKVSQVNDVDGKYVVSTIADVTNGADDTYYYYILMDGYRYNSTHFILDGGSGVVTLTLEGSVDPDEPGDGTGDWIDVTNAFTGVANFVATNMVIIDDAAAFKYLRWKVVAATGAADDADWTIHNKKMF